MPTLAQILGAVDFPANEGSMTVIRLEKKPAQSLDEKEELDAKLIDLQKGILAQNAIGK